MRPPISNIQYPISILLYVVIASIVLVSCSKADPVQPNTPSTPSTPTAPIAVTGVSLSPEVFELAVGESKTLTATVSPSNATNKSVTWSTSNAKVATVSDGKVSAVAVGEAVITVITADAGKTATSKVTVKAQTYPVTSVSLDKTDVSLNIGETLTLKATVLPANASNKNVSWSSSNTAVVTVSNGAITAVGVGSATITVTTADGGKAATCSVSVKAQTYPVTGVSLNKTNVSLTVGEALTLSATVLPANASNKNVTWSSSNSAVATVSNGVVTAVGVGSATITVITADGGKAATCAVSVKPKTYSVASVSLNKTNASLTVGETLALSATVLPVNASNKNVSWNSSNTAVATVSNGVVTAVGVGSVIITVITADGGKAATCNVIVSARNYPVTGVILNKSSLELTEEDVFTLEATVLPANATNKNVTWSSSNTVVATVSNGIVTARTAGTTTVTVKTLDGSFTAKCAVVVKEKQTNGESGNEGVGESGGTWY